MTVKIPLLLLTIPTLSTLAGGLLTLRLERLRPWLEAAGAGLLLGAAVFDLLPEALGAGRAAGWLGWAVPACTVAFLLGFLTLELGLRRWSESSARGGQRGRTVGRIGGGLLIFHSLRDGMAIGAAFAMSPRAGYAVALGIVAHDFADGLNTVLLTTGGRRATWTDYAFLAADALAPLAGGLITVWWMLSSGATALLLALAAAFFLEMVLVDLWPYLTMGRRAAWREAWPLGMCAVGGVAVIGAANWLLGMR